MTIQEIRALLTGWQSINGRGGIKSKTVRVERNKAKWTGKLVGVIEGPSMILEIDGRTVPIGIDGATVTVVEESGS